MRWTKWMKWTGWTEWTLWTEWTATRDRGRAFFILHPSSFILFFFFAPSAAAAEVLLTEPQATLTRGTSETVWISDIEHVTWKATGEAFLADTTRPVLMARDRIPAGNRFQPSPTISSRARRPTASVACPATASPRATTPPHR